jgi:hypothetical protein
MSKEMYSRYEKGGILHEEEVMLYEEGDILQRKNS